MKRLVLTVAATAAVALLGWVTPVQATPLTYDYTGTLFTFCGFGCPGSSHPGNVPADWASDYVLASITFAAPLAPNLPLTDESASLTAWTIKDALGHFSLSSAAGDVLRGNLADGIPPLVLSTNANGDIMNYIMSTGPLPGSVGTQVAILNPPVICVECGGVPIASFVAVNFGNDNLEWDAFSSVPGRWTNLAAVPEPATLTLTGLGLAGIVTRYRRRRSR